MISKRKKNKRYENHDRGCNDDYYSTISMGHVVFTLKDGYWIFYTSNGSLFLNKYSGPTRGWLNIESDITKVFTKLIDENEM